MRSGWPHTQEDPGSLASQRQAQYGPAESWPNGYPALGYTEDDHRYPTHGTNPYAADPYAAEQQAPAGPVGEDPYAAFGGAGHGSGGHGSGGHGGGDYATMPNIEAFGYGDPGYSDSGYDGPASQDAGIAGTQTVRGVVESAHNGGRASDIYHQPWDYDQPLRYDEEPSYPALPAPPSLASPSSSSSSSGGYGQAEYASAGFDPAGFDPPGFDPADYNGSDFSVPGITGAGYDLSGIIGTGEFPDIGYDQPGYDRLSYDDPRYDSRFGDSGFDGSGAGGAWVEGSRFEGSRFETRDSTRFDMPAIEGGPRGSDTRFDMPALGTPSPDAAPMDAPMDAHPFDAPPFGVSPGGRNSTRFDMPAVDDLGSSSRLDHVWPAREDLPDSDSGFGSGSAFGVGSGALNQTSLDLGTGQLGTGQFPMNQTRFDMPAVADYQYGGQLDQATSADGMRALAPETEFRPAGAGLVAPADEQPMNWADETSFDRFGDLAELDDLSELDEGVPAAFAPASPAIREDTGSRETGRGRRGRSNTGQTQRAGGKRRGRSGDRRQWLALGAIAVAAAGAISFVMMKTVFSGPAGPAHTVSTPDKVASFTRQPNLEHQMKVPELRDGIVKNGDGKISDAVGAVYQQGSSAIGSNPQTYIFVGGKLADSDPAASLADFEQKNRGAHAVSPGSLGGEAACGTATVNGESVSMCVWFDNDTFGEFVSPTMKPAKLASTMDQARPGLEHLAQ